MLRTLNNNPNVFPERRPIVMFAWENARALKVRAERASKVRVDEKKSTCCFVFDLLLAIIKFFHF